MRKRIGRKKRREKLTTLSLLLVSLIVLVLPIILSFGKKEDEKTQAVQTHIQKSPVYHEFHTIREIARDKKTEIFLEIGNYAWGGYQAILFLEMPNEVKLYSYLFIEGDFKYNENVISKKDFKHFVEGLVEKQIWEIHDYSDNAVEDGNTYFLQVIKGNKRNNVIVYGLSLFEPDKLHWDIITDIEDFCFKHIRDANAAEKDGKQ